MHSVDIAVVFVRRALVAVALLASSTLAAGQAAAPPPTPTELPASDAKVRLFTDESERMTVPVTIGTGRPLSFLIDTGAERSGVSTEVARDFRLRPAGERTVIGFAGRRRVPTVSVSQLRYARTVAPALEALLFSRAVIGADGFLGIDALAGQRVDFDFTNRRMQVRRAPRSKMQSSDVAAVVRATKLPGRLIFSNAEVDRVKADVLLDTGSSVTIGNQALLRQLRAKRRVGPTVPVSMLVITGEVIKADYAVLRQVLVGDVLIRSLPIAFATVEPFDHLGLSDRPALLLGMDALQAFAAVTVDFRSRQVRFQPRDEVGSTPETRLRTQRGW